MEYNIPQVWHVNKSLPTPLFKQLAENIKWSIYNGNIKPGFQTSSCTAACQGNRRQCCDCTRCI